MSTPYNNNEKVIGLLNEVLSAELTAINQYFIHAKLVQNWGFERLYAKIYRESIDEMKHAEQVIDRVIYLGGLPNMQRYMKVNIGETVTEQFRADLALENDAIPRLNAGIEACTESGDNGTRALLEAILIDEEHHRDWLETQLELIERIGEENYLAHQVRPE